ncbi:hypothetical protein PanWU01x14_213110 [Parasponia andersonii]|uniref:Uncharacterized protein n=1 Tax=Parasponia andersonii TaxID=3476 RepID=A0A2P5BSY1_PARAD|nr:hypothetical protein PanWU01x14_213110 [Parasponia andersonii]
MLDLFFRKSCTPLNSSNSSPLAMLTEAYHQKRETRIIGRMTYLLFLRGLSKNNLSFGVRRKIDETEYKMGGIKSFTWFF